jgi:hypothetical protein
MTPPMTPQQCLDEKERYMPVHAPRHHVPISLTLSGADKHRVGDADDANGEGYSDEPVVGASTLMLALPRAVYAGRTSVSRRLA